ncbi:MAG TPA: MBL fold metallo-hydrolase [Candidatus Paceibacterota bacterium]
MVITWNGVGSVRIQQGDLVLAFGPVSKRSKQKTASFGADVALVPIRHPDADGVDAVSRSGAEPISLRGPGEYEAKGLFVRGFETRSGYGGSALVNTAYSVSVDECNILYLGAIEGELSAEATEELPDTDILFVPIGGEGVLSPSAAAKLAVQLEPKAVIPIFYGGPGGAEALKKFLRESGAEKVEPVDRLTVRRRDLEKMSGQVVVLSEQ